MTSSTYEDVLLRDGTVGRLRPVTAEDEPALLELVHHLSLHTRYMRFFSAGERPAEWYVEQVVTHSRLGAALVAERLGKIVAVASFTRLESDPESADVGLLVDDDHQTLGLGSLLLEHLARLAWQQDVHRFRADVLGENRAMLHVFRQSGLPITVTPQRELFEVELSVVPSSGLSDAVLAREATAERASLRPLLAPRSIVVIGSTRSGGVPARVHASLQRGGFTGTLHHVEDGAELSGAPDLAVVAVPAHKVLDVVRDCGTAGVRALVVLSAGFAEVGKDGQALQSELVQLARQHDMRLVGPNCLGVVNTDPEVSMSAIFADAFPQPGGVALVSQSGAVGLAALRHAQASGTGLSVFVSTGNKADVSGNDVLLALQDDPRTRVIALYLESFGNAAKFARVAAYVGRSKPVVVLKSGRTAVGAQAGASHTAAAATPDAAVDALLRKAHALRAGSVPELFDLIALLSAAPLPRGPRVAVVGNSGGLGVLAADALVTAGLHVPALDSSTTAALGEFLPTAATTSNPVDLLAAATPTQLRQAVELILADPGIDAVLAIYTPLSAAEAEPFATALVEAAAGADKPLLVSFPGLASPPQALRDSEGQALLPTYAYPELAARALGAVTHWALRRPSQQEEPAAPDSPRTFAPTDLPAGWADHAQINTVLGQAGIPDLKRAPHAGGHHDLGVGLVREPTVGPLVHVGAGGALTEILDDHVFLIPPVTKAEARAAVLGLRSAPQLLDRHGQAALDVDAVADVLVALSDLALGLPEVAELSINPLVVTAKGVSVLDARMRIEPAQATIPLPSRALRHG